MHRNGTGVLNDFDLARSTTPGILQPRGFERTGIKPFLALDLLTDAQDGPVEQLYRHDLESFLWVLMWITACYDNGVASISTDYCRWLDEDIALCRGAKGLALYDYITISRTITKSYRFLGPAVVILQDYWQDFYARRWKEGYTSRLYRAWSRTQQFVESPDLDASPPIPVVAIEPSDEQVLFDLLHAFASNPFADRIRSHGLMDDLPFTLFPTSGLSS